MIDQKYVSLRDLLKFYTKKQMAFAFLLDFYFFIITGGALIVVFVNIIPMMIRFIVPGLVLLYSTLVLLSYIGKHFFTEVLQSYVKTEHIHYQALKTILTLVYAVLILLVMGVIFYLI